MPIAKAEPHFLGVTMAHDMKTSWARGTEGPAYRHFNKDLRKIHGRRQLELRPIAQHTAIMATKLTVQSERASLKQPHVFQNNKKQGGKMVL
jgi:hypothetical protein